MAQLIVRDIFKAFPGTQALSGADLTVQPGQVVAVTGKNGSGKSVLMGIISGTLTPDSGTVEFAGERATEFTPWAGRKRGVAVVPQEVTLVPDFTVLENAALLGGFSSSHFGVIDWALIRDRYHSAATVVGAPMSYSVPTGELRVGEQRLLMVACALMRNSDLLILDEPTISASPSEVKRIFSAIRSATARGVSVIYVSQRLSEVLEVSSELMVLRDGCTVGQWPTATMSEASLAEAMVGSGASARVSAGDLVSRGNVRSDRERPLLTINDLSCGPLNRVNMHVRGGEIVGLFGLSGSGKSTLLSAVGGRIRLDAGSLYYLDKRIQPRSPSDAIRIGIVSSPQSRGSEGIIGDLSLLENVTLGYLRLFTRRLPAFGLRTAVLDTRQEEQAAHRMVDRLNIVPPDIHRSAGLLSGGNQQKVVLGRWIVGDAQLFLLDEPMAGLDISAKRQVMEILHETIHVNDEDSRPQRAAIVVSSDPQDLESLCDRVYVLRNGEVAAELHRGSISEHRMMVSAGAEV
jgi:ABC-type sugar transport system ATPase subunit